MDFRKDAIDKYYEVHEELGRGQFAVVSLCVNKVTGEKFAAKCIQKKSSGLLTASRGVELRTIRREVEILQLLEHENIVRLFDVFEARSTVTLVLEYVEGGELFALVSERERLDEDEASGFVRQLLAGTAYLHANEVAHLDLKPENIMLERVGAENGHIVKIIDFGLAQRIVNGQPISIEPHGTAEFIPPEVLACELVDTSADLWMVGVIIYVLLSGVSPFAAENDGATFSRILIAQYSFLEEYFANVSDLAKDLIYKLIKRTPSERLTAEQALAHPWINPQSSEQRLLRKRSKVKRENLLRLKRYVSPRTRWKQILGVIKVVNRLARSRRNRSQSVVEATVNSAAGHSESNSTEQSSNRPHSVGAQSQPFTLVSSTKEASVTVAKLAEAVANTSTSPTGGDSQCESAVAANSSSPPVSVSVSLSVANSVPLSASQNTVVTNDSATGATSVAIGNNVSSSVSTAPTSTVSSTKVTSGVSDTSKVSAGNTGAVAVSSDVQRPCCSSAVTPTSNHAPVARGNNAHLSTFKSTASLPISNLCNGAISTSQSAKNSPKTTVLPIGGKQETHKRGTSSLNTALLNIRALLKPVTKQHK